MPTGCSPRSIALAKAAAALSPSPMQMASTPFLLI
jgi:hypothetical protein